MLTELTPRGFRNLEPLSWRPGAGRHLLLGVNGAGKTSLLEAIYVVATTRSFRTSQIVDCTRHGEGGFELRAEVDAERRFALEVSLAGGERRRAVNGRATSLAEHLAAMPVVAWTAAEGDLWIGPPLHRRRFLDRGVVGLRPAALDGIAHYRKTLAQKRELLLTGGSEISTWNELLASSAAAVIRARNAYVGRLADELEKVLRAATLRFPPIELLYRSSPRQGIEGEAAIKSVLDRVAGREKEKRMPLVGPHRDDLEILWGGRPLSGVASAGEKKALSVAIQAAHGRVLESAGRSPVYLLDDADAELAPDTLARLWRVFAGVGQLFATSNRQGVWRGLEVDSFWVLGGGRLSPGDSPLASV